ncbi:hypothetical protein PC128_g11392 [Phytophthora cactorum]|nr:hypothetical protein PC128_g11392 [Phytophthora cactorum]
MPLKIPSPSGRDEMKQMEAELTLRLQELNDVRECTKTSARTDVILSTSFWQDLAAQQQRQRLRSELERQTRPSPLTGLVSLSLVTGIYLCSRI